jgi:alpha-tubulin suppressor-like RCC1 family protein
MSWYGILYVSECGDIAQAHQAAPTTPLQLSQCDVLLGKKFCSISNDGENIIICCHDTNFVLYSNGKLEPLQYDPLLVHISSGEGFSVGITGSGHLYSWGWNGDVGQLGHGANLKKVFQPLEINFKTFFTQVQCGKAFSVALDDIGQAYAWGEVSPTSSID